MALSDTDYREVILHLAEQLEMARLGSVAEHASFRARSDELQEEGMRAIAVAYVQGAIDAISRRSLATYERAMELSREFIRCEGGGTVTDIRVRATDQDLQILGFDEISLSHAPQVRELLMDLREILETISEQ